MARLTDSPENLRGFWGIVAAQFTGAFNDNGLRWFLIAFAMNAIQDRQMEASILGSATVLFLLPYVLFSMHAGSLADLFSKRRILLWSKAAEAAVMALGACGFLLSANFSFLCIYLAAVLFLLGTQAAYYSPAKYGALPEILPERLLSWGNGILELTGFLAIISGSASGPTLLWYFAGREHLALVVFAIVALVGLLATALVPPMPPAAPESPVRINPLAGLESHGRQLLEHRLLFLTLLAVVYIWSLGVLLQLNIAEFATDNLGLQSTQLGIPMAIVAIGVGIGSLVAGYLSGKTIELGLVPIGSVGTAICSMAFFFSSGSRWLSFACMAILGFFAGLFIVPVHALLQEESEDAVKGGIWAVTNLLQTLGMLVAAGSFWLLWAIGLNSPTIFLVTGIGTLLASFGMMRLLPEALGRLIAWVMARFSYRVEVAGQEHVPAHGPLFFLVRGKPRLEGFLLLAGTRRFVRFVIPPALLQDFPVRTMLRSLKAICLPAEPAAGTMAPVLEQIERAIKAGDTIGLFAEGLAGEPGSDLELELSRIITSTGVPVIPAEVVDLERRSSKSVRLAFGPRLDHHPQKNEGQGRIHLLLHPESEATG